MDVEHQQTVAAIVRILRQCRSLLFVTGAGVSADSGVPTYRGIGGLYEVDVNTLEVRCLINDGNKNQGAKSYPDAEIGRASCRERV